MGKVLKPCDTRWNRESWEVWIKQIIFSKSIAKCMLKENVYTSKISSQKVDNRSKVVRSHTRGTISPFPSFTIIFYILLCTQSFFWNYPEMFPIFPLFCSVFIILVSNISIFVWNALFRRWKFLRKQFEQVSAVNYFCKKPHLTQPAFTFLKLTIETQKVWNMFKVNNSCLYC